MIICGQHSCTGYMFVGLVFICACVALLRLECRRCLVICVSRLTRRATGTPNPLRVFGARALIVSFQVNLKDGT